MMDRIYKQFTQGRKLQRRPKEITLDQRVSKIKKKKPEARKDIPRGSLWKANVGPGLTRSTSYDFTDMRKGVFQIGGGGGHKVVIEGEGFKSHEHLMYLKNEFELSMRKQSCISFTTSATNLNFTMSPEDSSRTGTAAGNQEEEEESSITEEEISSSSHSSDETQEGKMKDYLKWKAMMFK